MKKQRLNKSQRDSRNRGFTAMLPSTLPKKRDPEGEPVPTPFGGYNFFPTETPTAVVRIVRRDAQMTRRQKHQVIVEAMSVEGATADSLPDTLSIEIARTKVLVDDEKKPGKKRLALAPLCRHRGTWVNTRHNPVNHFPKRETIDA